MKAMFKMVSAMLVTMLVLAAFPTMGVAAHYHPCNQAQFIRDVTVPDGSTFAPSATFTKTWRVRNTGSCTWTTSYLLVFDSGEQMGAPSTVNFPLNVSPGQTADLTINMTTPATPGKYRSSWKLDNGSGERFGVGWRGGVPIFAEIKVVTVTYEFATNTNAAAAVWSSGSGTPPTFPSMPGSPNGSAIVDSTFKFESGVTATPGLLVTPDNGYHGYIKAEYPPYRVARGDRFQATVGCEFSATSCYVIFKLKYRIGASREYTLGTYPERHEGLTRYVNINLDSLAGKDVSFILFVYAYRNPFGDSAIWGNPVIVGSGVPTGTTPGGSTSGWYTYNDSAVPLTFMYPPSPIDFATKTVSLPITAGTNLDKKYLVVSTKPTPAAPALCLSSIPNPSSPTIVKFNGIDFNKEDGIVSGSEEWIAYSANDLTGSTCVSLAFEFKLLASPPAGTPTFNKAAESAVFNTIMSTVKWK